MALHLRRHSRPGSKAEISRKELEVKETEEKYENTLSALQQQVDSVEIYQEAAEKLRNQLEQQEQEFNRKLFILQSSVAQGHEGDFSSLEIQNEAANLEINQLRRRVDECKASCEERIQAMGREYEMKLENLVQQLHENLSEQEKELGERFEMEYEERARNDQNELEMKHKQDINNLNIDWEEKLQNVREEMLREHHAQLHNNHYEMQSSSSENAQIRILQTRVQELQDALTKTKPDRSWEADEDLSQSRIQELIGKLGEMEADRNRLKRKIEEMNKIHSQEIQSYAQTIQACFKDGDLRSKFEHLRKMQKQEIANTHTKLRTEYETKFGELKNRFEEKLREIKVGHQKSPKEDINLEPAHPCFNPAFSSMLSNLTFRIYDFCNNNSLRFFNIIDQKTVFVSCCRNPC